MMKIKSENKIGSFILWYFVFYAHKDKKF